MEELELLCSKFKIEKSPGLDGIPDKVLQILCVTWPDRVLLYETDEEFKQYQITSSVPHESVLGPFLWNVMYDGLLNMRLPGGARLIEYAVDIALVVSQSTAELIEIVINDSLSRCNA